ncbi:hypothetical protein C8R47DRAFT_1217682 [Mycena vitilis]|nr:hypothetical protein C8R47DRAFT_1217682 [Mycena vitilis]
MAIRRPPTLPDPSTEYHVSRPFALYEPSAQTAGDLQHTFYDGKAPEIHPNGGQENRCPSMIPSPPALEVTLEEALACDPTAVRDVQVWKVQCGGEMMVGRFYDPLYAAQNDSDRSILAKEISAYEALRDLQGVIIPRFLGCFSTTIAPSNAVPDERSVQVVLLGYIPGRDLRLPTHSRHDEPACDKHKAAVFDAVLLADHLMFMRGILHMDLTARNIILKDGPLSSAPFCDDISCPLRFKTPTESLVQRMQAQKETDYSKLTLHQLHSLPIAVIDLEYIETLDDRIAGNMEWLEALGCSPDDGPSRQELIDLSSPENGRELFMKSWTREWTPSTYI